MSPRRWPRREPDRDKPDVAKARAELAAVKEQRSDVEELVAALIRERHLNNFAANVFGPKPRGRQS